MTQKAVFPIQPELTAVAIAYRNLEFIADRVLPDAPVGSQDFKYMVFTQADDFTLPDTKVGRTSQPNRVEFGSSELTASTNDYGLDDPVPNQDIENAPPNYDPLKASAERTTHLIQLGREQRTASLVFTAANYPAANKVTLAGTSQFSDFANSDPLGVIMTGLDTTVIRPNVMVIGQAVWTKLRQHPKVVKAVLGNAGDSGVAARQAVAELLELEEVIVGSAWANTAKKGQTVSLARLWGKHVALLRREKNPNTKGAMPTFGMTARFGSRVAGAEYDRSIGLRGGQMVRVGESVKELIVASDLGYFIENAVA